jgi:ABC-type multidrug transport system fused ATPase/permease subunit
MYLLAAGGILCLITRGFVLAQVQLNASLKMHTALLKRVLAAPVSFFDVTPLGRIVNRFSSDMTTIDEVCLRIGCFYKLYCTLLYCTVLQSIDFVNFRLYVVINRSSRHTLINFVGVVVLHSTDHKLSVRSLRGVGCNFVGY